MVCPTSDVLAGDLPAKTSQKTSFIVSTHRSFGFAHNHPAFAAQMNKDRRSLRIIDLLSKTPQNRDKHHLTCLNKLLQYVLYLTTK
jgi:hypothetical protein